MLEVEYNNNKLFLQNAKTFNCRKLSVQEPIIAAMQLQFK